MYRGPRNPKNRFRSVMHSTGSLIIGDFTTAFFTGYDLPDCIENFFDRPELKSHLRSWFKFFSEEDKISGNGKGLSIQSDVAEKFGIICIKIWLLIFLKVIDVQFAHRQFILRFGYNIVELSEDDLKAKSHMYKDPWGLYLRNYISWRDAVCHYPHFIAGPSKRTGLSENEETLPLNNFRSLNFHIAGGHPYERIVNLIRWLTFRPTECTQPLFIPQLNLTTSKINNMANSEDIQKAIEVLNSQETPKYAEVARKFNLSRHTLIRRFN